MTFRARLCIAALTAAALSPGCDGSAPRPAPAPSPVAQSPPPPESPPTPPVPSADPNDRLNGTYSLTADLGASCRGLLGEEAARRYTATIAPRAGGGYVVTLSGPVFLSGSICTWNDMLGCHQFTASRQGDQVEFDLANNNDDAHGGHIVEQTAAGTWLEIIGRARGRFDDGSTIDASGTSSVWYCSSARPYPFPCLEHTACGSGDLKLRFVRK